MQAAQLENTYASDLAVVFQRLGNNLDFLQRITPLESHIHCHAGLGY
jgi:hypothetical protein